MGELCVNLLTEVSQCWKDLIRLGCDEVRIPLNFVISFINGRMQEWLQAPLRYVILKICHMRNLSSYYGAMGQHLIEWPVF
jgi:hypothetical protein